MIITLTGASGFVGKNLVPFLSEKHSICSINLRRDWKNTINDQSDVFIHLAGKAHDHKGEVLEEDFFKINYDLTKEFFESFVKSNASLFIHLSSIAAIEEESMNGVLDENQMPNPKSAYGRSKRKAEEFLLNQKMPDNKKIIIIRPTMIHGPGDKGNLSLLYKIISIGIPYPLGAFDNKRSFVSIDNLCFLIEKIIENKDRIPSDAYNFSDDEALSTVEIIKGIGRITNSKPKILSIPKTIIRVVVKIGDVFKLPLNSKSFMKMTSNLVVSNEKIKKTLDIKKLPMSAYEGLEKTIKSLNKK